MPYCFSRSYVKFQGQTALKIIEFDPNWAFPDSNSSLNSAMAMKCCTKLETAKERCPIVFQGHPSNFKVTRYKTSPILTQIRRFRTIAQSQLSNPSDLPCLFSVCIVHPTNFAYISSFVVFWWGQLSNDFTHILGDYSLPLGLYLRICGLKRSYFIKRYVHNVNTNTIIIWIIPNPISFKPTTKRQ